MTIRSDPLGFFTMLLIMTTIVYATRIGGFWLIGRVSMGRRLQRMLEALPGAVIAATVAPILLTGGATAWLAVMAAGVTMIVVRSDFAAVLAGVAVAALVRAAGL